MTECLVSSLPKNTVAYRAPAMTRLIGPIILLNQAVRPSKPQSLSRGKLEETDRLELDHRAYAHGSLTLCLIRIQFIGTAVQ